MQKQFETKTEDGEITPEALEAINRYTQTPLGKDEVFVFSAVLCDNEIDRDFERFTVESLKALAPLFEGKTAIQDHSMRAADQSARTFKTEVVVDAEKKTSLGEPYTYLKAYCYMPRMEKNAALIQEIAAGIKKEVSVGCAVEKCICSICGADERKNPCAHHRGQSYKGEICHYILENPTDAYEWSFVAVPAQKQAGVTKKDFADSDALLKAMQESTQPQITLTRKEMQGLLDRFAALEALAEDGKAYKDALTADILKGFAKVLPNLDNRFSEQLCADLSVSELKSVRASLRSAAPVSCAPQLFMDVQEPTAAENGAFKV